MGRGRNVLLAMLIGGGCTSEPSGGTEDTDGATSGPGTSEAGAGSLTGATESSSDGTGNGSGEVTGSGPGTGPGTTGEPPSEPGVHNTIVTPLPGDEPTACEWEWTIRTLDYLPPPIVPRRMYNASCNVGPEARMFTSLTVGQNAVHPEEDPSSGAVVLSELDNATGTLSAVDQRHFPECISMHGIAASEDCQTIGVLCRIPSGTDGFDADVLSTHPAADWMTQPYVCGDRGMNDEMWLFEWTNGDLQSEPSRYIVHKAIGSWEYGNNYLRLGDDGQTWGIAVKATVGGENGPDTCHEADAFLVMDRQSLTMTTRGWSWACGTGHTTFNRLAYNPESAKYAMLCSTDYNEAEVGGLGAFVFRTEDGPGEEFHHMNLDGLKSKGGASAIVPREGGGYVGLIVGVDDDDPEPGTYPLEPPTAIGLGRWDADGQMDGDVDWILEDSEGYLSYSTLSVLSPGRYLLGWGLMHRISDGDELGQVAYRVPWEYRAMEIDENGTPLSDEIILDGAGWGELDEMVPLGQGRAGWAYIEDPALNADAEPPECNQPALQLSVYTSENG